jgi:hypothetical protein
LEKVFIDWNVADIVTTSFSKEEVSVATWRALEPEWHWGYPQPSELEFGYLKATYDLSGYCGECGVGLKQIAPFQLKSEPKWGKRGILQVNWVFEEFFVTPEVSRKVFRPHGVESRPVLGANEKELKTVLQLIEAPSLVDLRVDGLVAQKCQRCGRTKFVPPSKGFYPALKEKPSGAYVKTEQYFGSGSSAYRGVIVSRELGQMIARERVRGASQRPVAER